MRRSGARKDRGAAALSTHAAPRHLAWGFLPWLISVSLRDGEEVQATRPWTVSTFAPIVAALCVTSVLRWYTSVRGATVGNDTARMSAVVELDDRIREKPISVTSALAADACSTPSARRPTALASGRRMRK